MHPIGLHLLHGCRCTRAAGKSSSAEIPRASLAVSMPQVMPRKRSKRGSGFSRGKGASGQHPTPKADGPRRAAEKAAAASSSTTSPPPQRPGGGGVSSPMSTASSPEGPPAPKRQSVVSELEHMREERERRAHDRRLMPPPPPPIFGKPMAPALTRGTDPALNPLHGARLMPLLVALRHELLHVYAGAVRSRGQRSEPVKNQIHVGCDQAVRLHPHTNKNSDATQLYDRACARLTTEKQRTAHDFHQKSRRHVLAGARGRDASGGRPCKRVRLRAKRESMVQGHVAVQHAGTRSGKDISTVWQHVRLSCAGERARRSTRSACVSGQARRRAATGQPVQGAGLRQLFGDAAHPCRSGNRRATG